VNDSQAAILACQAIENFSGPIFRPVIHGDDFQRIVIESRQGSQGRFDIPLFMECGDASPLSIPSIALPS
jgi:hypothetical protein